MNKLFGILNFSPSPGRRKNQLWSPDDVLDPIFGATPNHFLILFTSIFFGWTQIETNHDKGNRNRLKKKESLCCHRLSFFENENKGLLLDQFQAFK